MACNLPRTSKPPGSMPYGSWRDVSRDGTRAVDVCCPKCGEEASIETFNIDLSGKVAPSLICPASCGFHEEVRLMGWET